MGEMGSRRNGVKAEKKKRKKPKIEVKEEKKRNWGREGGGGGEVGEGRERGYKKKSPDMDFNQDILLI